MKENKVFLIVLVVIIFLFTYELDYVVYVPGGTVNLEKRLVVEGGYESEGSFHMAYVSMMDGKIPFVLLSYLMPNWDLVKSEDVKYETETLDEMVKRDKISMQQSLDNAIINAYKMANKEIDIKGTINHVTLLSNEAKTDIKLFDELISINDQEIKNLNEIKEIVEQNPAGTVFKVKYKRDGNIHEGQATSYDTNIGTKIGIGIITTYDYETTPKIEVKTKASESGPSGGMMMTLDIYNQLVEEDITSGKKIVGTGTIDLEGNVGAIGGVKYKILGAKNKKADIFLVPEENYEEAIQIKKDFNIDMKIVSVKNISEAIEALK